MLKFRKKVKKIRIQFLNFFLEAKSQEKPREKIFQRNPNPVGIQATETKNVVYVGDLEKTINKGE